MKNLLEFSDEEIVSLHRLFWFLFFILIFRLSLVLFIYSSGTYLVFIDYLSFARGILSYLFIAKDILHILLCSQTVHGLKIIHDVLRHQHLVHLSCETLGTLRERVCLLPCTHVLHLDLLQELHCISLRSPLLQACVSLFAVVRLMQGYDLLVTLVLFTG